MSLADLLARWRTDADVMRRRLAERDAALLEQMADELEAELQAEADELLTLEAAAVASGYSVRQLRHLIATGQVENVGRKHAPRVRRGALPTRPARAGATTKLAGFDADAFALELHARGRAG